MGKHGRSAQHRKDLTKWVGMLRKVARGDGGGGERQSYPLHLHARDRRAKAHRRNAYHSASQRGTAGFVMLLAALLIAGIWETVRQEMKLNKIEREHRREAKAPPRYGR